MSKYAVEVHDVRKSFFLPHHKNNSLKTAITQVFRPKEKGGETFNALDGVSFKVEKGDFFGILGRNGSGKSTLLKIISEIYRPTSGSVKHDGRIVSFIELGVGFKAELSGRENVFLNGALLGFSKEEVEAMYEEIIEFAELEQFMDQKLKNYSSGMKVRLAFSVAIRAKADILILDEVLAVGDAAFQRKCNDYFETLKDDGKTVILVTHNMGAVKKYCNKAILIEGGKIVKSGDASEVADDYKKIFDASRISPSVPDQNEQHSVSVHNTSAIVSEKNIQIQLDVKNDSIKDYDSIDIIIDIYRFNSDSNRRVLVGGGSKWLSDGWDKPISVSSGETRKITMSIDNIVGKGDFGVDIIVRDMNSRDLLGKYQNSVHFVNNHALTEYMPVVFPVKVKW